MTQSVSFCAAMVFVIQSVNALDAALAFTAQCSLYGGLSELRYKPGSLVNLGINQVLFLELSLTCTNTVHICVHFPELMRRLTVMYGGLNHLLM